MSDTFAAGAGRKAAGRYRQPRRDGSNTAGVVLAIALAVSVVGSIVTFVETRAAFARHTAVDQVEKQVEKLYRLQLEEDTGLRGFLTSGDKVYLFPYSSSQTQFDDVWAALRASSARAHIQAGDVLLADLRRTHQEWIDGVASPVIATPSRPDTGALLQRGKVLADHMHQDFEQLSSVYAAEGVSASAEVQALFIRAAASMATLILVFGFAAIVADHYRTRTQAALVRERAVTDTLQRAFMSGWDALPRVRVGTAYLSSTRDANVGGDLFDIHRIDAHRSVVLVADVSGKGLDAAVETAQVKYSVRTLAEDHEDPAQILARLNRAFIRTAKDPTSFVSVFLGMLDDRGLSFRYASAGHSPAYIRRAEGVENLRVTGPLVGLSEDAAFGSATLTLAPGDVVVLATDGLTEARDSAGVQVDDDGVMRWIASGRRDAEGLADELVHRVARFAGGRINDDLALLILEVGPEPPVEGAPRDDRVAAAASADVAARREP